MSVKLLTENHLEFLSLTGGCAGSSESAHVKCHIVGNHMSQLILQSCQSLCCLNTGSMDMMEVDEGSAYKFGF